MAWSNLVSDEALDNFWVSGIMGLMMIQVPIFGILSFVAAMAVLGGYGLSLILKDVF